MSLSKETEVVFDEHKGVDYGSADPPLYDSSTSHQKVLSGSTEFDHTRSGNSNRQLLGEKLTKFGGGQYGLAYASSIAAMSIALLILQAEDRIILPDDMYGGTFGLAECILSRFNIEFTTVNTTHPGETEQAIQPNTKLIYIETPSNPYFKITDIKAVAHITKKHDLLLTINDTFVTPLGQSPLVLGVDIVVHSTTKFLGGHNDIIAGAAITNRKDIAEALYLLQNRTGTVLPVHDSWTLTKHLKTLPVRFRQFTSNAEKPIDFLSQRGEVAEVYYPGNSHLHLSQAKGGGVVIGFRLKNETKAQAFVDALTLPLVSVSLGGVETIFSHPATMSHAAVPEEVRSEHGITFGLFRLSVGLEQPEELIDGIDYALKEAFNESIIESFEGQRFSN